MAEPTRCCCATALLASFHDQLPTEHAHLAVKLVLPRFFRKKRDGYHLALGQRSGFMEVGQKDHFRAGGRLLATELQPHGPAMLYDDQVGRVAATDHNHRLLHPRGRQGSPGGFALAEPEKPDDEGDSPQAAQGHDDSIHAHTRAPFAFHSFRRFALLMTVTELKDIAAAARSGESRMPKKGEGRPLTI